MPEDATVDRLKMLLEQTLAAYQEERDRFRTLRDGLPPVTDSAIIHEVNARYRALVVAQKQYRAARRAYREHLLQQN